jgi:hypothetical protein
MKRQRHFSILVVLVITCVCPLLVACAEFPIGVERTFVEPTAALSVPTKTVLPPTDTVVAVAPTLTPVETGMPADLVQAREALQAYLHLLHDGHYAEAASYYGGDYEVLWDWNPTVAHDDHATLLENGCKANGLQCLAIQDIASEQEVSPGEYLFTVEFRADDGSTFTREPSVKQFNYTVKKVDGQFLVQELPVYVP